MQNGNQQPESRGNQSHGGNASVPKQSSGPSIAASIIPGKVAVDLESTQIRKFASRGGTGFAAEDANALFDERLGHKVEPVGRNNAKNGADRLVDGHPIQTKYFDTASRSIGDAFDSKTGLFRYGDMPVEVPRDQADAAVKIMADRIKEGRVPGYTDPSDAHKLIKQGSVTYKQARNIARAGNIDSLKYDARNSVVVCASAFGIGFLIEFGSSIWRGESPVEALKNATMRGIQTAGIAFLTYVGSAQLLRTQAARVGGVVAKNALKGIYKTSLGKDVIHKIAQVSTGNAVYGAAARNHAAYLLRSNVVTGAVTLTVLTLPDIYKATITGSKSWAQVGKNLFVAATGLAAGGAGITGGAALGATVGTAFPVVGTVAGGIIGGTIGGLGAGSTAGALAKHLMDKLVEDDAVKMQKLLDAELTAIAFEHLFSQKEFDRYLAFVGDSLPNGFLSEMFAAEDRRLFVRKKFEIYAMEVIKARELVLSPDEDQVLDAAAEILDEAEAETNGVAAAGITSEKPDDYVPNFTMPGRDTPTPTQEMGARLDTVALGFAGTGVPGLLGRVVGKFF